MKVDKFNGIVVDRQGTCRKVLSEKAGEYAAGGDRLSNFKTAAALQRTTALLALAGMMAKHVVAFFDFAREGEKDWGRWEEKLTDLHNYLHLAEALILEGEDTPE